VIELATTIDQELREMDARVKAKINTVCWGACETADYSNIGKIRVEAHRRTVRGKRTVVATWHLNGRRLGWNALMGKLRDVA